MDRRKEHSRVPLWIRSSPEEQNRGRPSSYRPNSYWSPQQPYEPQHRPRPKKREKQARQHRERQHTRPPRRELVPVEQVTLRNPVHLADWERRDEVIEDHGELVQRAEETQQAPWRIQVWSIGDEYVLARGFASLAAAVDAGLSHVPVIVAARFPRWELHWVDPQLVEGLDPLLSKALQAKEKLESVGWVFPPLAVTSAGPDSYTLGRGKRAAARLWAAQELQLEQIPVVIRPKSHRAVAAGTVQIEVSRVRIVLPRHLRKMHKPLPARLLHEVTTGQLRPIRVRRIADGTYELVDGLLRLRAAQEAGAHTIQAIIELDASGR